MKTIIQTGSYPIAMIPYINMAPYRKMGPPAKCHFVSLVPKKSIEALQKGSVMAAAVIKQNLEKSLSMKGEDFKHGDTLQYFED